MKKTFLTTLTLLAIQLCSMQTADAQNLKFGKPSADEMQTHLKHALCIS